MKTQDFSFELPPELIAKHPLAKRSDSRLLHLARASGQVEHLRFDDLSTLLKAGDLLVFNDTRVIPARLYGRKESGGRVEALIERMVENRVLLVQLRVSKPPRAGCRLFFEALSGLRETAPLEAEVIGRRGAFFEIRFLSEAPLAELLDSYGHVPLPPYIDRADDSDDRERYQTVYARNDGAVAAPTAGLHFDDRLLAELENLGIDRAFVTLHVGAGTFQPVRVDDVKEHQMHSEWFELPPQTVAAIKRCRENGGRVVAVGTTSVRTLESCALSGELRAQTGETDIFIYPGFEFQVVDALITNFHLPESTLLMLISAFADKKMILDTYKEAVRQRYRFFSYGDAMLIS